MTFQPDVSMAIKQAALIAAINASDYLAAIEREGFAIIENVIAAETVEEVLAELRNLKADEEFKRRAGQAYGIRNLLNVLPSARALAKSDPLRALIEPVLGGLAQVVRGIYFDKHREANWKVAWHQDLTIAVREPIKVEGYSAWSVKAGITHVQPPVAILENMLALRLHLDDTDEANGALRVIPGSHRHGRLLTHDVQSCREQHGTITCRVKRGGVMLMRPLLLHASSVASHPGHRRVLHFEYSASTLSGGLNWYDA